MAMDGIVNQILTNKKTLEKMTIDIIDDEIQVQVAVKT